MKLTTKILGLATLACVAASSTGYILFPGSPRWPTLSGGWHYIVTLRNASFTPGSDVDNAAQWALSDLRDLGDTDFKPGLLRANASWTNHGDGKNVWIRFSPTGATYLAVTFVRWSGSTMKDCDIWYNMRYSWGYKQYGPDSEPAKPSSPYDFRGVARHEAGHAIGFNHENRTVSLLNSLYTRGTMLADHSGSGMMPHATDKHGVRVLYAASQTVRNVYAGRWREPATTTGSTAARRMTITGTWAAGAKRSVECWLSNQSNVTITGGSGSNGIRVGVYLSTNSTISTSDTLIGQWYFTGNWPAHASGRYVLTPTVPSTMTPGTYYVGVIFDNTNKVAETSSVKGWETDNDSIVGRVTVTNVERVLTVRSINPSSGVPITVSLTDRNGNKNGTTTFTRRYWGNRTVSLTAPTSTSIGPFRRWVISGVSSTTNRTVNVNLNANRTATAEYWRYFRGTFTRFGTGCPGTRGIRPVISGSGVPDVGNRVTVAVTGARRLALGRLLFGISNRWWGRVPLPLDLKVIGAPGCMAYVSLDLEVPIRYSSTGTFTLLATIPKDPSEIGRHYYMQAMVIDPGTRTPLKIVTSNGLDIYIGGNK